MKQRTSLLASNFAEHLALSLQPKRPDLPAPCIATRIAHDRHAMHSQLNVKCDIFCSVCAALCCYAGEWPYTIVALAGDQALNSTHGKRHFQLRKVMQPAFLAETTLQYIARTFEIAEVHCQQWAEQKTFSGAHAVRDFAFQVGLWPEE